MNTMEMIKGWFCAGQMPVPSKVLNLIFPNWQGAPGLKEALKNHSQLELERFERIKL